MVKSMKEIGSFNLKVEFEHVLQTDLDMAIDIVNLNQRKKRFLVDQDLGTAEELNQRGTLEFQAMPQSIKRVKEYFVKKHDPIKIVRNLLGLGYDVHTLSNLTKALLRRFAEEIFHTHSEYLSWEGGGGGGEL
uniref:Uncharacterized protein n=1 Tax=Setaria viridis TaxID=4556 RepID=A0A4U6U739_SETVI|nr:hypothetical protein SEVIR_7G215600v2 [Setaria viridis]TKW06037.1 hypothetical protein SEVIR_7G215600v2 [Setaria viridis]